MIIIIVIDERHKLLVVEKEAERRRSVDGNHHHLDLLLLLSMPLSSSRKCSTLNKTQPKIPTIFLGVNFITSSSTFHRISLTLEKAQHS